jgi:hypothetical protein
MGTLHPKVLRAAPQEAWADTGQLCGMSRKLGAIGAMPTQYSQSSTDELTHI